MTVSSRKFNRQQLKDAFKILGCKLSDTNNIVSLIFKSIVDIVRSAIEVREEEGTNIIPAVTITSQLFEKVAMEALEMADYSAQFQVIDFRNACDIVSKRKSIIILLGGTSGTGKSTLSSLIASRLGISTILSTDSIRHILRNFLPR